jgi:hypothetical protein
MKIANAVLLMLMPLPALSMDVCDMSEYSCYDTTMMKDSSSPASHTSLRRGDGDMRKLATEAKQATIIDYTEDSWTLSRDEVVEAVKQVLSGAETNFQLNEILSGEDATALQVFLITEDSMTISTQDLDKAFTITNAFIEDEPGTMYQVNCPAKGNGDTCTVKKLAQQDEAGNDLVTCFAEDSTITKEDIPAECGDEMYDMALYALPGPHFILAGTKSLDSSSVNPICPKSIAFSTIDGKKQIVSPYMEDFKDLPKHTLGVAALADVLEAESGAEAIDEASYDMLNNNCVHYASSIWRRLGFDETEDLGNYVVHNIVIDEGLLEKLASKVQGGRRLLNAMLNKRYEEFVKNVVYSQLYLN